MVKKILIPALIAAAAVSLAGCHGGKDDAAAKAQASALATSSAIAGDKAVAEQEVTACVNQVGAIHIVLHPVKDGAKVVACAKAKAADPAKFDACADKAFSSNLASLAKKNTTPMVTALANCVVAK
jgi:hypothetical protein